MTTEHEDRLTHLLDADRGAGDAVGTVPRSPMRAEDTRGAAILCRTP
jgi:hypothetical protein